MATKKLGRLNIFFVLFSLLVVAGAAYFLSKNQIISFKPGASTQGKTLSGKLFKRGSDGILKCVIKGVQTPSKGKYPSTQTADQEFVVSLQTTPGAPGQNEVGYAILSGSKSSGGYTASIPKMEWVCTGVVANGSSANGLVGQYVTATGVSKNNVFYAVSIKSDLFPGGSEKDWTQQALPSSTLKPQPRAIPSK